MPVLHNGDNFPSLSLPAVGGGRVSLPADLAGGFGVVLFYRGHWCPYCNAQLAAFARAAETLTALGIKVVALSVDDQGEASALADRLRLPPRRRGRTPAPTRDTSSPPGSCSTPTAESRSRCTPAARSAGWFPTTSPAMCGT